nr:hypothetical protein MACL_00003052 [Theileria orientalis]
MTKYEVLIFFDSKNDYYVPKSVPYDKVSSRFKKYSHKILYKEPYKSYEYDVNIYDERKKFVWDLYPFCYYHPTRQVESVEFYFSFDDTNNENPLVAGFVQKDLTDTVYYRYNFLKGRRTAHGLPSDGLFKAGDLLTVLLQEKYKNQNNILTCPRLKPSAESAKYPSVGDSDAVTEYYELSDKDNLKWTKISDTSNLNEQSELENKLKRIRYGLGISYEKSPDKLIIKSAENCKEDSVAGAVAGTFSVLGLTGAGVGLAYYKFPEFFISLFRKVLIWTPIPVHY